MQEMLNSIQKWNFLKGKEGRNRPEVLTDYEMTHACQPDNGFSMEMKFQRRIINMYSGCRMAL